MRYMVVERFKTPGAADVYRRFAEKGRMMPDSLRYLDSWISADMRICYQLMETDDYAAFAQWTRNWDDLVDFEIVPVMSSAEARANAAVQ